MQLRHRHIVPFIGIVYGLGAQDEEGDMSDTQLCFPQMLSLKMENGKSPILRKPTFTDESRSSSELSP